MGPRVAVIGNSDALGLLAAGLGHRGRAGPSSSRSSLGADATADDFERALDGRDRQPRCVDSVIAVFIPPLNTTGGMERAPKSWLRWASSPTRPRGGDVPLPARASPSCCGSPTSPAARGPRVGPVVPGAPEAAVRALARVVEYAGGGAAPRGDVRRSRTSTGGGQQPHRRGALRLRGGRELTPRRSASCWAAYGIDLWPRTPGRPRSEAVRRRGASSGGTSCSRRPPSTCGSDRTSRTCGATSTTRRRCATPGTPCTALIDDAGERRVRRAAIAPAGVPIAVAAWRTRCSARSCRSGCPARRASCSGTARTGSRR